MRVHLSHPPAAADRALLCAGLPASVQLTEGDTVSGETDILVSGRPSRAQLNSELSALVIPYAGLPGVTRSLLLSCRPDLPVYNLHHNAPVVAEMALALLLAVTRYLVPMDRALRASDWRARYQPDPAFTLSGRTVLILGLGAIGRRLARPLQALGARVTATRRRLSAPAVVDGVSVYPSSSLDALLPEADAVIVALPHTPETDGLLGARRLSLLPPGAALVNVARARIVDEDALFAALKSGQLCGAGLDVWYQYPRSPLLRVDAPPCRVPLWELPNVVFSPHRAGHVQGIEAMRMQALAALLAKLAAGRIVRQVQLQEGY